MPRLHWEQLPVPIRAGVSEHAGHVVRAESASEGIASDIAAVLHLADGSRLFCKAVHEDDGLWMLANEIRLGEHLPDSVAPRVLWSVAVDGWTAAGFEYVPGRHLSLAPGSEDLPGLAKLTDHMSRALTPTRAPVRTMAMRWANLPTWDGYDRELLAGETLIHTDLTAHNILTDGHTMRVIDWAWPARGAAWIDTAFLTVRLVAAGHSPADAQTWASTVPAFQSAPSAAVTAFAVALTDLWTGLQKTRPAAHREGLLTAADLWLTWRLDETDHGRSRPRHREHHRAAATTSVPATRS